MRCIVITGSARGLGLELARAFLERGCRVTLSSKNPLSLKQAEQSLATYADRMMAVCCDVRSRESLQSLWDASINRWGRVDVWINNAGVSQPSNRMLWELPQETTDSLLDTNIAGVVYGSQIAAAGMLKQGSGAIYNMEGLGCDGRMIPGTSLYGTSKWTLNYFTRALAKELSGTPVKAGRLMPGMMVTDFITKPSAGEKERVVEERTRRIFNILGDRPDTVANYLVTEILKDPPNSSHIVWLTTRKVMGRFLTAPFRKRDLFCPQE